MRKAIWAFLVFVISPAIGWTQAGLDSWENLSALRPGQKIQIVETKLKSHFGTFVGYTADTISMRVGKSEVTVPKSDVLRVSDRERSHTGRNALIGMGVGAAAGIAAGAIAAATYHEPGEGWLYTLFTLPAGAGAGAVVGAAISHYPTIYRAPKRLNAPGR